SFRIIGIEDKHLIEMCTRLLRKTAALAPAGQVELPSERVGRLITLALIRRQRRVFAGQARNVVDFDPLLVELDLSAGPHGWREIRHDVSRLDYQSVSTVIAAVDFPKQSFLH